MKTCSKCCIEKPETNFNFKNKSKDIRTTICKECLKDVRKQGYEKNKIFHIERVKDNKQKLKVIINSWFDEQNFKCFECGETHPACLDFHHRDPKEKEFSIAHMRGGSYSLDKIKEEIEKCDVLCSNCHRKLHWNEKWHRSVTDSTQVS